MALGTGGAALPTPGRGERILVVDDEEGMCAVVSDILAHAGYSALATSDPRGVVGLAIREKPAIVLVDISMPQMDGYEVMDALRREPRTAACPIVFITGRLTFTDRLQAFRKGAKDFLSKPFQPAKLIETVDRVLKSHGRQND
jgi:CheY-like chemotaxis protein